MVENNVEDVKSMKVILSRKGFDSSNGGIVSPFFENGSMISFPIPSYDGDTYDLLYYDGTPYSKILRDLHYKGGNHCHVDPDLDQKRRGSMIEGWFPAFGQTGSSAAYLNNNGIEKGDLFLFFGNFHCVENRNGSFSYTRSRKDFYKGKDLQVIWGYLQIGDILDTPVQQKIAWWHPHASDAYTASSLNVIYKAAETLSFDDKLPGAGLLRFDIKRVLTKEGENKATWVKNPVYDVNQICGNRINSAKDPRSGIYYAGIWQELCLKESDACTEWAKEIIL